MDEKFIRDRITHLRLQKNISEYKMSLDLGHSKSYIQSITSGRAMPSMTEFLYICDYLGVTPKDFFDDAVQDPYRVNAITEKLKLMSDKQLSAIEAVIEAIMEKS